MREPPRWTLEPAPSQLGGSASTSTSCASIARTCLPPDAVGQQANTLPSSSTTVRQTQETSLNRHELYVQYHATCSAGWCEELSRITAVVYADELHLGFCR